ncbi:alpha/beta hydrolase [Mucilaginibacter rubeus]|nr:alpha/beta hydrolase [Mucilaginibacter rubeus]QEM20843.1 alpha/beta hydrolase [Mucilaginibacter gossypii]
MAIVSLTTISNIQAQKASNKDSNLAEKAQTQYATIVDHQVAYRKFGKGTPVIIANRFRGTLDTWDPLFLDQVAKENTVIIYDYSGIGDSKGELPLTMKDQATEITKLADFLKIDKFNVMGWSYGGWIAQYTMFYYPSRVLKTVVIDANAMGKNEIAMQPAFAQSGMKANKDLGFEDNVILFFEPKSEVSRAAARKSEDRIAKRLDMNKVPEKMETLQRFFAPNAAIAEDKENFRAAYATLKTPVLVISGDNDISFAVDNWYPLIRKAPSLQLIVMPDAGHGPHHQYPDLTAGYINTFLNTVK